MTEQPIVDPWGLTWAAKRQLVNDIENRNAKEQISMEISGIITALIIGLIIGALGRLVVPGKQNIPIWLTLVIGVVAAFIGTLLAGAIGVAETPGIDWIELALQIGLAAVGVAVVAGTRGRSRV